MARNQQIIKIYFPAEIELQSFVCTLINENSPEDLRELILHLDDEVCDIDFTEDLLRKFVEVVAKARKEIGEDFDINEFAPQKPKPVPPKVKQRKGKVVTQGDLF